MPRVCKIREDGDQRIRMSTYRPGGQLVRDTHNISFSHRSVLRRGIYHHLNTMVYGHLFLIETHSLTRDTIDSIRELIADDSPDHIIEEYDHVE